MSTVTRHGNGSMGANIIFVTVAQDVSLREEGGLALLSRGTSRNWWTFMGADCAIPAGSHFRVVDLKSIRNP